MSSTASICKVFFRHMYHLRLLLSCLNCDFFNFFSCHKILRKLFFYHKSIFWLRVRFDNHRLKLNTEQLMVECRKDMSRFLSNVNASEIESTKCLQFTLFMYLYIFCSCIIVFFLTNCDLEGVVSLALILLLLYLWLLKWNNYVRIFSSVLW